MTKITETFKIVTRLKTISIPLPPDLLPSFIREPLEKRRLEKKSYEWGYKLRVRQLEGEISYAEFEERVREAKETMGLNGPSIWHGSIEATIRHIQGVEHRFRDGG